MPNYDTLELCKRCHSRLAERYLFTSIERYCAKCDVPPPIPGARPLSQGYDIWNVGEEIPEEDFNIWVDMKSDWLKCDGQLYNKELYRALHNKLGNRATKWNDPSDMFRVPDRAGWRIKAK